MGNPKDYNFLETLKKYLKEGAEGVVESIDLDAFKKDVDENYVNEIVKYRTTQAKDSVRDEVAKEATAEILKGLGVEGDTLESAKAFVKRLQATTTEKDEMYSKLEQDYKTLEPFKEEAEKYKTLYTDTKSILELDDFDVVKKHRQDVYNLAKARITEEKGLEDVLKEMKSTHASFFNKVGAGGGVGPDDPEPTDEEKIKAEQAEWEKKYI